MRDGNVRNGPGVLVWLTRQISEAGPHGSDSDRELLVRFATERDESAVRALIGRHGPMVLRVCSRILGPGHDVEDAFQATFLVLARKAAELQTSESVGSWLFGVAHRVSMKMRTAAARRRSHEREAVGAVPADPVAEVTVREAQGVLDDELAALPERFRAPLVLCCLEGLTRDEAARQLGVTRGTLKSRLERARGLLRTKLARRGLPVPAALLADLLGSVSAAPAAVAAELVDPVVRIAVGGGASRSGSDISAVVITTAEGVVRAMTQSHLKMVAVLSVAVVFIGTAVGTGILASEAPPAPLGARVPINQPKAQSPPGVAPAPNAPTDRWNVEFANEVTQVCEMRKDGTASVTELLLPKYEGKVTHKDPPVLVEYSGDRTQRFTPVGQRMVVEHWYPGAKAAATRPILGIARRAPTDAPTGLRYTDDTRGFRLIVPEDWAVVPTSYLAGRYRTAFLGINNRGDRALRVQDFAGRGAPIGAQGSARRLDPGTVYIELAHSDYPEKPSTISDTVESDLIPLLKGLKPTRTDDGKLSEIELSFAKRQRRWNIHVYFREPVEDKVRESVSQVLRSVEFIEPKPVGLPVGKWSAEFANGVKQVCEVRKDGTASVAEPRRAAAGKAKVNDGSAVIVFEDDRVERWTAVGDKMVVEHWYPGTRFPTGTPVLGIAVVAR